MKRKQNKSKGSKNTVTYWSQALTLVCTANRDMATHTMVTIPMVISTMYVSWKADIVAAQYDMDSVWNTKHISHQLNVTRTASEHKTDITPAQRDTDSIWTQNRYHTSPTWHGQHLNTKQISHQPNMTRTASEHKTDITPAQRDTDRIWTQNRYHTIPTWQGQHLNTKQISHQPNMTRTASKHKTDITPAQHDMDSIWTQSRYHTSPTSCGKCLEHKTHITAAQCDMDSVWNINQMSYQPNVTWTASEKQNTHLLWMSCEEWIHDTNHNVNLRTDTSVMCTMPHT
jgi:hypothetical protein